MANRTDTQSVINLVINGRQAMTSLRELTDTQRRLNTEVRNMRPNDPGYRDRLRELQAINHAIDEQRRSVRGLNNESRELQSTWRDVAKGIISANFLEKAWSKVSETVGEVVDAYAEMAKYRAMLTVAFKGNGDFADKELKMLSDFAAKTPYQLNEVTSAFISLVNRGIVPTYAEMEALGDIASSQGKSIQQYIEAILDAQTGEFTRLKEFGIAASKSGDQVSFSFKGITKEVSFSGEAIKNALIEFGKMEGVAGSMKKVSEEVEGLKSNIEDNWNRIFAAIGKGSESLIKGFYRTYGDFLEWINKNFIEDNLSQTLEKDRMALVELDLQLQSNNTSQQTKIELLNKLKQQYPDYFKNLSIEKGYTEDLANAFKKLNNEYLNRIILQKKNEELQNAEETRAKTTLDLINNETEIRKKLATLKDKNPNVKLVGENEVEQLRNLNTKYIAEQNKLGKTVGGIFDPFFGVGTLLLKNKRYNEQLKSNTNATKSILDERDQLAKRLGINTNNPIDPKRVENPLTPIKDKPIVDEKAAKKAADEYRKFSEEVNKAQTEAYLSTLEKYAKEEYEISQRFADRLARAKKGRSEELKAKEIYLNEMADLEKRKNAERLKEQEKFDEETKKLNKDEFKKVVDQGDANFNDNKTKLNANYAADLATVDSEEAAAQLKEAYQQRERDMTEEHLLMLKMLYEAYGEDASEIDKKLADSRLADAEREAKGKIAWTEAKKAIDASYVDLAQQGTGVLMGLVNKQSSAYKGLIVLDKAFAIAKVIMNTQAEISGYFAKYALIPGGQAIALAEATAAKIRAGVSIGMIAATGIGELVASNKDSGEAHAKGITSATPGKKLLGEGGGDELVTKDGKWWLTDGPTMATFTGGERVFNASETADILKNNLYPVKNYTVNTSAANAAERAYRTNNNAPSNAGSDYSGDIMMLYSSVESLRAAMEQEKSKSVVLDYKTFDEFKDKIETSYNRQIG